MFKAPQIATWVIAQGRLRGGLDARKNAYKSDADRRGTKPARGDRPSRADGQFITHKLPQIMLYLRSHLVQNIE